MRSGLAVATLVASLLSLSPWDVAAHPGHDHKVMGTIAAIDGNHVLLKTNDGKEMSFEMTKTTTWLRGKEKGSAADLKVGMRVVVNLGEAEEPLKAKEIQYAGAAGAKDTR